MAKIFGIDIKIPNMKALAGVVVPVTSVIDSDSTVISQPAGGINTIPIQYAGSASDKIKVETCRQISNTVYADLAITEYVNESFVFNDITSKAFEITILDDSQMSEKMRTTIIKEANLLYGILDIRSNIHEWYRSFYVDGRLVFNILYDKENLKQGVVGLVQLNPLNVMPLQIIPEENERGEIRVTDVQTCYVYNQHAIMEDISSMTYYTPKQTIEGIIFQSSDIIYVKSGLRDAKTNRTISYLDKSIVPYNNLKMMEDAMSIYRVVRAPMRRAFFVDTSMLQPSRAEAYMKQMKEMFQVKIAFDPNTGALTGDKGIQSILEDYWLPRQSGTATTDIQNIEGGNTQDIIEEVEYYRGKYWDSLTVPKSRFVEQSTFSFNRSGEIQRDEYRFHKNMSKIRNKMMEFFLEALRKHLSLKGIIKEYEWQSIQSSIVIRYAEDNLYAEFKDVEKLNSTLDVLDRITPHSQTYFSHQWVKDNVLKQNDEEQKKIAEEIKKQPKEDDE